MEITNELLGKFKTEIILWLVFYAMYLPLSILIWLKSGRPTNVTIAGVMTVGTICIGIVTLLKKAPKPKLGISRKRELRHPEVERIPVSSPIDNVPMLRKSPEVKQENENKTDIHLHDAGPDSIPAIGSGG